MLTKTVYEEIFRFHEFKRPDGEGWLADQETLASAGVTIIEKVAGTDRSSTMIDLVSVYAPDNTAVKYKIKAGTANLVYTVSIKGVTSNGQKFEDTYDIKVV
jgi:hypothetical protein